MNKREAQRIVSSYNSKGLVAELISDEPNKIYPAHKHHETKLITLSGDVEIIIEGKEKRTLRSGDELTVLKDQLHEAIVGKKGWHYIAVWDEDEAKKYKHIQH